MKSTFTSTKTTKKKKNKKKKRRKKKKLYKLRPATRLITCANHGNDVHEIHTVYNILQDPQMVLLSEKGAHGVSVWREKVDGIATEAPLALIGVTRCAMKPN